MCSKEGARVANILTHHRKDRGSIPANGTSGLAVHAKEHNWQCLLAGSR